MVIIQRESFHASLSRADVALPQLAQPATTASEEEGWISSSWGDSENHRRAKFYRLTKAGRKQLEVETTWWGRISWAIDHALEAS